MEEARRAALCGVLDTKRHNQARDINMYYLFTEHSEPPSYIQSTFLPSTSSRDLQNRSSHILISTSLSRNVGKVDYRKPFSPTISGSYSIHFWFPTSSTGAGTTFATP
ncbi:hypothetical protein TNCV_4249071 [Trichonephila clavipes]|nr:hypothetical protein TNCV_4249071 [Trichonephila clavipes]